MDTIAQIVKSIVMVMMIASLLEIIMPRSDLKRYINLIIGLFIIMSFLNPILALTKKKTSLDIFKTNIADQTETTKIIEKGQDLAKNQKEQAVQDINEKLSRQIAGLSALYGTNSEVAVKVDLVKDGDNPEFGQIDKITLSLLDKVSHANRPDSKDVDVSIEEIKIDHQGEQKQKTPVSLQKGVPSAEEEKLKNAIADFYGLSREKVVIIKQGN